MTGEFTAKASYGQVFAVPQFRAVFAGRLLGVTADSLRSVVLALVVYSQTRSPLLSAVAMTIGFLPQAAGGVFLAAMADRFPPRTLITTGYALQGAVGLLIAFGRLPVGVSLLLVAAAACLTPAATGASARLLADILSGDAYVLGRSLSYLVAVAAQMAGLAAGGALTARLGAGPMMAATAGGHLLAAVISLLFLPRTGAAGAGGPIVRKTFQGNAALAAAPGVVKLIMVYSLPAAYLAAAESLLIPYCAHRAFGPAQTGMLLAAPSVGMLIGDLAVGLAFAPAVRERLVLPLLLVLGAPAIALVLNLPYPVVAVAYVVTGTGSAYLLGLQQRFVEAVPPGLQGQGFALLNTTSMTLQGIGPLVFGASAEFLPVGLAIALTGISSVATTLLLRNVIRPRSLHKRQEPVPSAGIHE